MVDVDNFKWINDEFGHRVGDLVLQKISEVLRASQSDEFIVCRYGGEEFCVLLPATGLDLAENHAERFRDAISETYVEGHRFTASFGVTSSAHGAKDEQEFVDQADRCLYFAKRTGKDKVIRWDRARFEELDDDKQGPAQKAMGIANTYYQHESEEATIPFHAVSALVSALAYRDSDTAEHSRRVADLCVAVADGWMNVRESLVLETAALLHDIGKIGVPDSILLKPGTLTNDEWEIMSKNDRIGVEIVQSTFSSHSLVEIVSTYHAWYDGNPRRPDLPVRKDIVLGARILAIADAFDSMTTTRAYRTGRSEREAFGELRECAGRQFDPELVARFIEVVSSRNNGERVSERIAPKAAALNFGSQVERLADAVEKQDFVGLTALANRLQMTATKFGIDDVAELATDLECAATGESDFQTLLELTNELVNLCRLAQRSHLRRCHVQS